jgi:hypothetical protein
MNPRSHLNLFSNDTTYAQHSYLHYLTSGVERRFVHNLTRLTKGSKGDLGLLAVLAIQLILGVDKSYLLGMVGSLAAFFAIASQVKAYREASPWSQKDLFISAVIALTPTLWTSIYTTEECLAALLPGFVYFGVISKDWIKSSLNLVLTSSMILMEHSPSLISVLSCMCLLSLLSYIIELDTRVMWRVFDSNKRTALAYYDLFYNSVNIDFITDADTHILCLNSKAKALMRQLGADALTTSTSFNELAEECGVTTVMKAVESCRRGEAVELELVFGRQVDGRDTKIGVYLAEVCPVSWKQMNSIKFTLTTLESVDLQRKLLLKQSKEIANALKITLRELDRSLNSDEQLRMTDILRIQNSYLGMSNLINFQMLASGTVELTATHFNLQNELINKIEFSAHKAFTKDLDIRFIYEACLPRVVVGDAEKISLLVKTLVEFAVKLGKAKTTIHLRCECQNESEEGLEIKLSISFTTYQLTAEELSSLFVLPANETYDLINVMKTADEYGSGIAFLHMTLKTLSGRVQECFMHESSFNKAYITIM